MQVEVMSSTLLRFLVAAALVLELQLRLALNHPVSLLFL
jgi:hypothetical protein